MTPIDRPENTLFLLISVDGKISSGDVDKRDFDIDLPHIKDLAPGLHQYYDIEKTTDAVSLNTGRTMVKIGANRPSFSKTPVDCSFVIIDRQPHLTQLGVTNLLRWVKHLYIVTTNNQHPACTMMDPNLTVIKYEDEVDLPDLFQRLKSDYDIEKITIQSGGTLNAALVRLNLIDHLMIVVAPALVGGKNTSTLIDGPSLQTVEDLELIRPLKLQEVRQLESSYLLLKYDLQLM